jgi:hypothetical protein
VKQPANVSSNNALSRFPHSDKVYYRSVLLLFVRLVKIFAQILRYSSIPQTNRKSLAIIQTAVFIFLSSKGTDESFSSEDGEGSCWVFKGPRLKLNPGHRRSEEYATFMSTLNTPIPRFVLNAFGFPIQIIIHSFSIFIQHHLLMCGIPLTKQHTNTPRGSVFGWNTMLHAGRSWIRFPMRSLDFSIDLILPAALWPWGQLSL